MVEFHLPGEYLKDRMLERYYFEYIIDFLMDFTKNVNKIKRKLYFN